MRSLVAVAATCLLLGASGASAETRSITLSDVGTMISSGDETRFLLGPSSPIDVSGLSIDRAVIEIPLLASRLDVDLRVVAWPADGEWTPGIVSWDGWTSPGGDYRRAARGRGEVKPGTNRTQLAIDVTGALRGIAKGRTFYGFLLTVPPAYGVGFDLAEARALEPALSGAKMSITYSTLRPDARRGE